MRKFNNKSRRSIKSTKSINKKKIYFIFITLIFLAVGFLAFLTFRVFTLDKFIYVNRTEVGDAEIIIIDTKSDEILNYKIPADTELEASNGYGVYKLKNLWVLSNKDVAKTIVKNYSIPVYLWKDGKNCNLSFLQKLRIFFIKTESRELKKSDYINFSDNYFAENAKSIEVRDVTGDMETLDEISKIIETIGGKITLNSKGYDKDLDCEISGKNKKIVNIINNILGCKIMNQEDNSKDLVIKLGAKFTERF